jgi:beta-catenin-like protein 1
MTSVDDLFKKPGLPGAAGKRKLDISHDPSEYYKSPKLVANGDAKGKSHASVEDEEDEDMEAGPAMPPDNDEEADYPEDDEDRFFGGGVDKTTAAAMDFLDERDKEETFVEEKYDVAWVRKLGLNFEKRISRNQELRAKFEDDPQKFMASEADLDADIKALSILSEHPELYEEFVKLGCMESLVSLIGHENVDIAIDAIEIISELIDDDVEADQEQWDALVNAALDADLLDLLISILSRFDENQEADRSGIYNSLNILESLGSQSSIAARLEADTKVLPWLLERVQKKEVRTSVNKQYSAEVLAIMVQSSIPNRVSLTNLNGVDILLQLLAPYRRRDPEESEEEEFVENVFDALTCLVDEPAGKAKFVEAEGVELALIMLREGKISKPRALRLLDHAVGGSSGAEVCEKLVDAQGIKTVFGMFMKKQDNAATEHLLGIFAALLRCLPGDSAPRIRVLAKFMEKDYEKIEKIVKLRKDYAARVSAVDIQIEAEKRKLNADELGVMEADWFARRLDAGLYCLQTIDVVLAWLVAEDNGARKKIVGLLAGRNGSLIDIKRTLQEQMEGVTDDDEEAQLVKEMLGTLVDFLK